MRARAWAWSAAILVLGGWIYWPALQGTWIWDDLAEIPHNAVLSDPSGLAKIWMGADSPDYFPLKTTLQWFEWRVWGDHPLGYHWMNFALQGLSALLLWRLLRQLGVRHGWIGALVFMVHPLAVESVAWISELKNTLSLPPLLLAMSAYVQFRDRENRPGSASRWPVYFFSLAWFVVALLCKSTVAMFPVVLVLYDWWRRGRMSWPALRSTLPFFAAALVLGLVTIWFQEHRAANGVDLGIGGIAARLAAAGLAIAFYVGKSVLPVGLMPNYPRWDVIPPAVWQFWPWVALAGCGIWLWTRRTAWSRGAFFGAACFVVNLIPVLGLIPMSYLRISWVADHFAYLSLVSVAGLAAAGWSAWTASSLGLRRPWLWQGLLLAIVAALAVQSHRYARIYQDDDRFWSYAVAHNPDSWVAQNNLGLLVAQAGRRPEALAHYQTALRLNPNYAEAHLNLANALLESGRYEEALAPYEWVAKSYPNRAAAQAYYGLALARVGRLPEAIDRYQAALRLDPALPETENNLGNALARVGRGAEAAAAYARALHLRPGYAEAELNWGNLLSDAGQIAAAVPHYTAALQLRPNYPEAEYQLGNALANKGQMPAAIARYRAALRLRPNYAEAHANLGLALVGTGDFTESLTHLQEAVRLNPDYAEAHAYFGFALAKAGRLPEAIEQYGQALRLRPGDADMHYNLGLALRAAGRAEAARAEFDAAARLGGNH